MMTGRALEYFRAFARCCPPHPVELEPPGCCLSFLTLENSIKHCLRRIKLGILIMIGTRYVPPQARSGLSVDEYLLDTSMQPDTKRSPKTLEYDVSTSAKRISPNLPSCASAIPPMLIRFKVERNR